jgi:hypothetical protein
MPMAEWQTQRQMVVVDILPVDSCSQWQIAMCAHTCSQTAVSTIIATPLKLCHNAFINLLNYRISRVRCQPGSLVGAFK